MEMYLLKSAACLAFLMLFYKLLLEKESFHVFKRYYLLAAVVISGFIPLITFTTYIETAPMLPVGENWLETSEVSTEDPVNLTYILLWSVYLAGVLLFGGKFIRNLFRIISRIRKNQRVQAEEVSTVLLWEDLPPHTFWSYVFLNKQKFQKGQIPKEVLEHEKAHAVQKHTADILFLELLQVFLWFNPLIYLLKRSVKLNHEFLADRAVLSNGIQPATYQRTLLAFSSSAFEGNLVNSINYQSIKKRFTVMKTKTSRKMIWAKSLVLLPLLAVLTYSFSSKEILTQKTSFPDQIAPEETGLQSEEIVISETINIMILLAGPIIVNGHAIALEELPDRLSQINTHLSKEQRKTVVRAVITAEEKVPMKIISEVRGNLFEYGVHYVALEKTDNLMASPEHEKAIKEELDKVNHLKIQYNQPHKDQEKATPKMVAEYNKLARHYREQQITEATVQEKDFRRMMNIFGIMTEEQRKNAEKLPPPPPPAKPTKDVPPPPAPTVTKDGDVPPPPPPPPAPEVEKAIGVPAPPPPPPSPVEAVEGWVEEGAIFYLNGKKISGKEALEVVKENNGKNLSVQVEENASGKTVRLSDNRK